MCMTHFSFFTFLKELLGKCALQGSVKWMINIQQRSSVMSHSRSNTDRINGLLLKDSSYSYSKLNALPKQTWCIFHDGDTFWHQCGVWLCPSLSFPSKFGIFVEITSSAESESHSSRWTIRKIINNVHVKWVTVSKYTLISILAVSIMIYFHLRCQSNRFLPLLCSALSEVTHWQ